MLEAFELREVLEMHAIRSIYASLRERDLENLEWYVNKMEECLPIGDEEEKLQRYSKFDQLFHQEICALTGNRYLIKAYRANMLHLNIALTFRAGLKPDMERVSQDHRDILQHLKGNSPRAVEVLEDHLERCKYNMVHGELFRSLS
jgi:DNA-binding GntR family transcriptional regulator